MTAIYNQQKINLSLPTEVKNILKTLKNAGFGAYVVGGSVRDLLINLPVKDWDFTTNAPPENILTLFSNSFYDNKFGTVGVPITKSKIIDPLDSAQGKRRSKKIFEITTFRSEAGFSDHRHPDKVIWGKTIEEDLARRDFTINALAYDGKSIIDPFNGQSDLNKKIIKTVGVPNQRFNEDALRLIRAVRLATELDFTIDENTYAAIKKNASMLAAVSSERIRDELLKILVSPVAYKGILLLKQCSLLAVILPELEKCFGVEQKSPKRHHIFDVGTHLVMSLKNCPSSNPVVKLATLLHDIGKVKTYNKLPSGVITFYNHEIIGAQLVLSIATRLRFSKPKREKLIKLVRYHQFTVDERQTDSAIRRFIRNVGIENINDILALRIGDRLGGGARETSWRLELYKKRLIEVQKQPFSVSDLKVDGYDVMKIFNISPGPTVGKVLSILFQEVVEGKIKNDSELLSARVKELHQELSSI